MNILYIFGNGFDLNFGLKTSYFDFYEFYKNSEILSTKSEEGINEIINFKKNIIDNKKQWSDFELAFGQYVNKFRSIDSFDYVYNDVIEQLKLYLKDQEKKLSISNTDADNIISELCTPEDYLDDGDRKRFSNLVMANQDCSSNSLNFINLNYTNTVERIFNKSNDSSIKNIKVLHLHGDLDDYNILGVSNEQQLDFNSEIEKNDIKFIKRMCIKQDYIEEVQPRAMDKAQSLIRSANIIVIFGSSLGKTDDYLWEMISNKVKSQNEKQKKKVAILFFPYKSFPVKERVKNFRYKDSYINRIYQDIVFRDYFFFGFTKRFLRLDKDN